MEICRSCDLGDKMSKSLLTSFVARENNIGDDEY